MDIFKILDLINIILECIVNILEILKFLDKKSFKKNLYLKIN